MVVVVVSNLTGVVVRDELGFAEFVRAEQVNLVRLALLLVGDRADAEDLAQVCLVRMSRRWDRLDEPHAYARTVLASLAVDRWRRLRRLPIAVAMLDRATPGDHAADTVTRSAMLHELRQLPTRQRAVLVLRFYEGWSEAEIAAALGCSPGTVKTHAARGLARLRTQLTQVENGGAG